MVRCHGDHPGLVCTSAKLVRLQATGIIDGNLPEAAFMLDRYTGSIRCAGADRVRLLLGQVSCNAQITYSFLLQQQDYKD